LAKKKKKIEKPHREFTKRQLSHWQQQQRRQRIILSTGIFVISAVVVISLLGWYLGLYRPMQQTVIRVNDTEFNMKYYVEMLKLGGQDQSVEYLQTISDSLVKDIEQAELIRQGALELDISVSDEEAKRELTDSDLPDNAASRDIVSNQLITEKLSQFYFENQVPATAIQVHMMAILLESESHAAESRNKIENGEDFGALAGELSLDYFSKANEGDFGWHPENILREFYGISSVPVEYAFNAEAGVLSQSLYDEKLAKRVGYWLIKVISRGEDEEEGDANIHAMLLGSEAEAQDIRARLEAGGDFATLAKEFSQLTGVAENGGNLGMVAEGEMPPTFDAFAFNMEIELNTLSEPIRDEAITTVGGYWLVKVLDRDDDRQIDDSDRSLLKNKAMDEWVASLWENTDNVSSMLDAESTAWAINQALRN